MANTGILKEYAMSVNDFKQPAEALGKKAIGVFLVRLLLLEKGTDLKYGARPLRRAIQKYIEDELSEKILRQQLKNGQNIEVISNHGTFEFKIVE